MQRNTELTRRPSFLLRKLVSMLVRVGLCAIALSGVSLAQEADPPNVLFIAIDDLNDWVGCLSSKDGAVGHPQALTPNIDRLATSGVNFTNAHCQAPICNPSRVSLILGKLPSTTGMYFLGPNFRTVSPTREDETMFQTFRKSGYYLTTMGKIFHGRADPESFDHVEPTRGWRRDSEKIRYRVPGTNPLWDWGEVSVPDDQQRDYHTAKWGADQIPRLAGGDRPFFLALGFHLPHVPIYASKRWMDLHPLDQLKLPRILDSDREDVPEIADQLTLNPTAPRHAWMVEHDEARHAVRAYLAAVSFVDSLVGMLLESLRSSGAQENTVIVLWSDHGFHLGEKLRWAKRTLWEESTRVPLIFAGPGVEAGFVCDEPVGLIDIFPTLLDLCGLPPRSDLEGLSLKPLVKRETADARGEWTRKGIVTTFGPNHHSIRSNDFRYTRYADGSEELFDHRSDPHEWKNLADVEEFKTVIDEHRQWLPQLNVEPVPNSSGADSPLFPDPPKDERRRRPRGSNAR